MPNNVTNRVVFVGEADEVKRLREYIMGTRGGLIDFEKIIPMPDSLHITCGGKIMPLVERDMRVYDSNPMIASLQCKSREKLKEKYEDLTEPEKREYDFYAKNLREHGHLTWYTWSIEK